MKFVMHRKLDGEMAWHLLGEDGATLPFQPGGAPGITRRRGFAAIRKAVKASLRDYYEGTQSVAGKR